MNIYTLLPLIAVFANLLLGVYVVVKDWRGKLNRAFGRLTIAMALWALTNVIMNISSPEVTLIAGRMGAVFSMMFGGFLLHFFLRYTNHAWAERRELFLLLIPIFGLSYVSFFTNRIYESVEMMSWGMSLINGSMHWMVMVMVMVQVGGGLWLCWRDYLRAKSKKEKSYSGLILLGVLIPFLGGVTTEIILPLMGLSVMPMTATLSSIAVVMFAYVIVRYRMMLPITVGSIGHKLMLGMLLVALIPLVLVGYVSFRSSKKILLENALYDLEIDAQIHTMELTAMLGEYEDSVKMLSGVPAIQGMIRAENGGGIDPMDGSTREEWMERLEKLFIEMARVNSSYLQLRYLDKMGQEVVRVDSVGGVVESISEDKLQNKVDRYYFAETISKQEGELFISPLDLNREGSLSEIEVPYKPVIRYGAPVMSRETGEVHGIVLINILADDLLATFDHEDGNEGKKEYFVNEEGYYFSHPDKTKEWGSPRDLDTGERIQDELGEVLATSVLGGERGSIELSESDQVLAYYPSYLSPESYYTVVELVSRREVLTPIIVLRNELMLLAVGLGWLAVMFSVWFSRSLSRPIGQLTNVANALSSGNLLSRARTNSHDEIGVLADSFNKMADSILESRSTLEAKVEERTKELSVKKGALEVGQKAILNILEDVEEEQEKTMRSEKRFSDVAGSFSDWIWETDTQGKYSYVAGNVEEVLGYSAEEMIGKTPFDLMSEREAKRVGKEFLRVVKKKLPIKDLKNILLHKDGHEINFSTSGVPIIGEDGELLGYRGVDKDVTREEQIDQMKTDFISLASHQLRTPLSAMKWFLEMLLDGDMGKLSKAQKEAVDNVEQSNDRMIALVNALLNVSRIESGRIIVEPEKTDIGKLVKSVVSELKEKFSSKKQKVTVSVKGKIPQVMVDPKLLRQVIVNLLTNANKYSPDKGKVEIELSHKKKEIVVMVRDTGVGIPKEDQARMFERFFRASNVVKQETDGTGLGLYLAKIIVESSGGKMWFESVEDKGTTFWFSIPEKGVKAKKGEVRLS